jgi:hypothetical protein
MKITRPMRLLVCALFCSLASISMPSQASIISLSANIDGAQANAGAGTGSAGTGLAAMVFDDVSKVFSWDISWAGLSSPVSAAHFHGPALPNANAGVQVPIDFSVNPTSGNAILSIIQETDLLNGLWYVNIHTVNFGGGEIRGQVIPGQVTNVSAPGILSLVMLSMISVFYACKRIL